MTIKNILSAPDVFKLNNWVLNSFNAGHIKGMSRGEVARKATEELKFPVTQSNIRMSYEAVGIKSVVPKGKETKRRLDDLEERVKALEEYVTRGSSI